jgi:hypothetical protein
VAYVWRRLGFEQKVAAVAALLLIASTFGPFSMVEAAMVLTGLGVLALLRARAQGRRFHLPFGDGGVLLLAAGWYAVLILVRVLDRPLGQTVLALACATVLAAAGLRERARRPSDDIASSPGPGEAADATAPLHRDEDATQPLRGDEDATQPLRGDEDATQPLRGDEDATLALPPTGPRPPRPQDLPRPR